MKLCASAPPSCFMLAIPARVWKQGLPPRSQPGDNCLLSPRRKPPLTLLCGTPSGVPHQYMARCHSWYVVPDSLLRCSPGGLPGSAQQSWLWCGCGVWGAGLLPPVAAALGWCVVWNLLGRYGWYLHRLSKSATHASKKP